MKTFYIALVCFILMLNSCEVDNSGTGFAGPSEINLRMNGGPYSGENFALQSTNFQDDLNFKIGNNLTRVFVEPLEERSNNRLVATSSINLAWSGSAIPGTYSAIFITDPLFTIAGSLVLQFQNGDELLSNIPKGALITISEYGEIGEAVVGQLTFTNQLDFMFNNRPGRVNNIDFVIDFKLKRGENY
ncbi:MAG: hypothetical protein M3Q56_11080 [Bacteroidota bacterium]|nr:hypothetical protein [Bacteroidota bacterium]